MSSNYVCYRCNKRGHISRNCPELKKTMVGYGCGEEGQREYYCLSAPTARKRKDESERQKIICYACGQPGHKKYECTQEKKRKQIKEEEERSNQHYEQDVFKERALQQGQIYHYAQAEVSKSQQSGHSPRLVDTPLASGRDDPEEKKKKRGRDHQESRMIILLPDALNQHKRHKKDESDKAMTESEISANIKKAVTSENILDLVKTQIHNFSMRQVSTAVNRICFLDARRNHAERKDDARMKMLYTKYVDMIAEADCRILMTGLWAFTKLGISENHVFDSIADSLIHRLEHLENKETTLVLWAYATTNNKNPKALFIAMLNQNIMPKINQFDAGAILDMVKNLTRLQVLDSALYQAAATTLLNQYKDHSFKAGQKALNEVAHLFIKANKKAAHAVGVLNLLRAIGTISLSKIYCKAPMHPQDLIYIVSTFTYWDLAADHRDLLEAVAQYCLKNIHSFEENIELATAYVLAFVQSSSSSQSVQHLLLQLTKCIRLDAFSLQDQIEILFFFAERKMRALELLEAISAALLLQVHDIKAEHLAKIAWAYTHLDLLQPPLLTTIANCVLPEKLSELSAQALAQFMCALTKIKVEIPKLEVMTAIQSRSLSNFTLDDMANIAWSLVSFGIHQQECSPLFLGIAQSVLDAPSLLKNAAHDSHVKLVWAFASLNICAPDFFKCVAAQIQNKLNVFNCNELASIAWSYEKARLELNDFTSAMIDTSLLRLDDFKLRDLSKLTSALSKSIGVSLDEKRAHLLNRIAAIICKRREEVSVAALCDFILIFTAIKSIEVEIFFEVIARPDKVKEVNPQALIKLVDALTLREIKTHAFFDALPEAIQGKQFHVHDIIRCLRAIANSDHRPEAIGSILSRLDPRQLQVVSQVELVDLVYALMKCRCCTESQLYIAVAELIKPNDLSVHDLDRILRAYCSCAHLESIPQDFLLKLIDAFEVELNDFQDQGIDVLNILTALAQAKLEAPALFDLIARLTLVYLTKSTVERGMLLRIARAFALVELKAPDLFHEMTELLLPRIHEYRPHELSDFLWSFAQVAKLEDTERLLEKVMLLTIFDLRTYTLDQLATFAYVYAITNVEEPAFLSVLAGIVLTTYRNFTATNLTKLLWSFATVQIEAPTLFYALAEKAKPILNECTAQEIATLVWSFSFAHMTTTPIKDPHFEVVEMKLNEFTLKDLTKIAWALTASGIEKPQLMAALCLKIIPKLKTDSPQNLLPDLAWSFANKNTTSTNLTLFTAIAKLCITDLNAFTIQDIVTLVWAFARIQWPNSELFIAMLSRLDHLDTLDTYSFSLLFPVRAYFKDQFPDLDCPLDGWEYELETANQNENFIRALPSPCSGRG